MDPAERLVYPEEDHARHSRTQAARLRAALTAGSDVARAARIVAELQEHRPEFVRLWELQEVAQRYDDSKTIVHPELGRIDVDVQVLFTENRAQTLVVLTTRPGTESHSKLELLSVTGEGPPDHPFPDVPKVTSGGVNADNAAGFLTAGRVRCAPVRKSYRPPWWPPGTGRRSPDAPVPSPLRCPELLFRRLRCGRRRVRYSTGRWRGGRLGGPSSC